MAHDGVTYRARAATLVALIVAVAACSGSDDASDDDGGPGSTGETAAAGLPEGWDGYTSDTYAEAANWLCKPGREGDVCTGEDLDATEVAADLTLTPQPFEAAEEPAVDCFYVYPTNSQDEGLSADLEPADNQEVWVARNQAARFTGACRVFAPVYRQMTVSGIGAERGPELEAAYEGAYADVLDAFKQYVVNESDERGFVLIGHSQGAGLLRELIADEVDGEPALRGRLVAAYLLGTTVEVPEGEVVGGTFENLPLCEAGDQTGCVVSYATFRDDAPPPDDSRFGLARTEGMEAACVNPAAPGSGRGMLQPYFPTSIPDGALSGAVQSETMSRLARLDTAWVTMPDFVEAECNHGNGASYLSVTIGAEGDQRGSDVGGVLGPDWGLHLVDVNLAMGNLVAMVASQATAYSG
jgi:hypothetical protein